MFSYILDRCSAVVACFAGGVSVCGQMAPVVCVGRKSAALLLPVP